MATKTKSSKPVSAVFTVPDPDKPLYNVQAEVGGTATWENQTLSYPEFEICFNGSNPVDGRKNATFRSEQSQPVVLTLVTAGEFHYTIKHIKCDGTHKVSGKYSIGIAPPNEFFSHCKGCPPVGPGI